MQFCIFFGFIGPEYGLTPPQCQRVHFYTRIFTLAAFGVSVNFSARTGMDAVAPKLSPRGSSMRCWNVLTIWLYTCGKEVGYLVGLLSPSRFCSA